MLFLGQNKKKLLIFFVIFAFSLFAVTPLFQKGFFVTDDGEWMIIRFSAFFQALKDGQFPVRFVERLNFSYGYPVPTFLYPGFMYLSVLPHLFKLGFVASIKIIIGASFLGSGIFTYLWLRKFFNQSSSLIGALVYVYAPYHLYDLYVRGSVGELLALGIVPFVFWQIERKSIFWSGIGISILILSHNSLAVLFISLIILYAFLEVFISKQKRTMMMHHMSSLVLGIGLSAFFWIPSLFELQYTVFPKIIVSNFSEYFAPIQLIGYSSLLTIVVAVVVFMRNKSLIKKHRLTLLLLIVGIISAIFASPLSYLAWKVLPVGFIQFPFRFLSITIFCVGFITAFALSELKGFYRKTFIILLLIFIFQFAFQIITKVSYFDKGDAFYSTNEATTTVKDEYMPVWVKEKPVKRFEEKIEIIGAGVIGNQSHNNRRISFVTDLPDESLIQVNTIYWPGWKAFVDEREVQISYNNPMGLMKITVPAGKHLVRFNFGETKIRFMSNLISIVSFVVLCAITMKGRKDNA